MQKIYMSMYPGQTAELILSLEQVKVLASAIRNQVFWAFTADEPVSTSDIARDLNKSAQTIHYHVNELATVGLIIPVAERKRRARVEKLYVRTGVRVFDLGAKGTPEYNFYRQKAFAAMMRTMTRESGYTYELMSHDSSVADYLVYERLVKRLTRKQAMEFQKKARELLNEIAKSPASPGDAQVHMVVSMRPSMAQSRHWSEQWGVGIGKLDVWESEEEPAD